MVSVTALIAPASKRRYDGARAIDPQETTPDAAHRAWKSKGWKAIGAARRHRNVKQ